MKVIFILVAFVCMEGIGELVVKVRNNGGEVVTEVIEADVEQDTLLISFTSADGTLVKQFIDYTNVMVLYF